eukprot:TRINITY_DN780486_c0_g1_i1.p1 TRINITY_DN780486_c0_g1~~TRINITY_DN780486_c0_g1_i1.p1  ORF type:complete len:227 (-),score=103.46 TRINITY_DN780486_c0_g1_i1:183-863(-)
MGIFFSKRKNKKNVKKRGTVDGKDRAILDLKNARDKLKRYSKKMETEKNRLQSDAKEMLRLNKKQKALVFLKLKKYKEQMLSNADSQLFKLEEMIETIQWETQQMDVLNGLKAGNAILKQIHTTMPLDEVEKIMDDTAEAVEYQNELAELLGGSLTHDDMDAINEELAMIEQEQADAETLELDMPEAPTHAPVIAEAEAEEVEAEEEEVAPKKKAAAAPKRVMVAA